MRIGEIARRAGVSRDAVRLYERRGLLGPVGRPHPTNEYKDYPPAALRRVALVRQAQSLGFTLGEIAPVVAAWDDERLSAAEKSALVRAKLAEVDRKAAEVAALRAALVEALDRLGTCAS